LPSGVAVKTVSVVVTTLGLVIDKLVIPHPASKIEVDGLVNVMTTGLTLDTPAAAVVTSTRYVGYNSPCVKSPDSTPEDVKVRTGEGNSAG
jgi:hypothetical protein